MNVLVIGGGVIGLSIARELHIAGVRDITVADKGLPGHEASWAAAGMLAPSAETEGIDEFYSLCSESNALYPAFADSLFSETGIGVGLDLAGTIQLAFDGTEKDRLSQKYRRQHEAGISAKLFSTDDVLRLEPNISPEVKLGIGYPNDRQVDNRRLIAALMEYCRRNEIRVLERSKLSSVSVESGRATGAIGENQSFPADVTILATGAWSSLIEIANVGRRIIGVRPIRGQMIAFQPKVGLLTKVIYGSSCYLVPRADGRVLVGATVEDVGFANAVTDAAVEQLRASACQIVPKLADWQIVEKWSGLRPRSTDGWPIIGRLRDVENLFVATGHYRNGILLAPLTAKMVADAVTGKGDSPYLTTFGPDRFERAAEFAV